MSRIEGRVFFANNDSLFLLLLTLITDCLSGLETVYLVVVVVVVVVLKHTAYTYTTSRQPVLKKFSTYSTVMSSMQWIFAFVVALFASMRGYKRHSLSLSGALAALASGTSTLGTSISFGMQLLAFYFSGTAATRFGRPSKALFEPVHVGGRGAVQVLATAGVGLFLCAVGLRYGHLNNASLRAAHLISYAAAAGDTLASELGSLATAAPVLITAPWRRVPRGTNGGVTFWGFFVSICGGALIGLVAATADASVDYYYYHYTTTHAAQAPVEHDSARSYLLPLLTIATASAAGFIGSLLDSILGAVVQVTYVESKTGRIASEGGSGLAHVSGAPLLSNEGVNFISQALTVGLFYVVAATATPTLTF